jgi:hypothetical protein
MHGYQKKTKHGRKENHGWKIKREQDQEILCGLILG